MEKWRLDQLVADGTLAPGGIGRRARLDRCHRCGRLTFTGLDADVCAGMAVVDIAPLNALGELIALTARIPTYDLAWRGYRYEIDPRESLRIAAHPPGTVAGTDVVSGHRCGIDIAHRLPSTLRGPKPHRTITSDDPPF